MLLAEPTSELIPVHRRRVQPWQGERVIAGNRRFRNTRAGHSDAELLQHGASRLRVSTEGIGEPVRGPTGQLLDAPVTADHLRALLLVLQVGQ